MRGTTYGKHLAVMSVFAVGATTITPAIASAATYNRPDTATLVRAAEAALQQRTETLVRGAKAPEVTSRSATARLGRKAGSRQARSVGELDTRRRVLAENGETYSGAHTKLSNPKVSRKGKRLVLKATELTTVWFANPGNGPANMQQSVRRSFKFTKSGKLLNERIRGDYTIAPFNDASGASEAETRTAMRQVAEAPKYSYIPPVAPSATSANGKRKGSYTRLDVAKATAYAYKYWNKKNKKYKYFKKQDCTNFANQVFHEGGWRYTKKRSSSSTKSWYYNKKKDHYSSTWVMANRLGTWIERKRATYVGGKKKGVWKLSEGDLVQADWKPHNVREHAMFVTKVKRDASGKVVNLYLTYHTVNNKDRSLKNIIATFPKAKYYALKTKKT